MGNEKETSGASRGGQRDQKLQKKPRAFELSQEPVVSERPEADPHKYEATPEEPPLPRIEEEPPYEDLGTLPSTYDEEMLFLVARDPRWLFLYWDFDWSKYPPRLHRHGAAAFFLRISDADGAEESMVEINPEARNWYVPVSRPDTTYVAQLGYLGTDGKWQEIATSAPATTPPDTLGNDGDALFATIPQHLAFERLLNLVAEYMRDGETLVQAVARIAGEGKQMAIAQGTAPAWTDGQRAVLAALLGESLVDRIGLGSAEIDHLLRKHLLEKLQSESASELSARFYEQFGPTTSSLFSAIGASWSAQPFSARAERGFFMHVNAEIIFYGGTHPDANLWINGRRVALGRDGTFRYHFTFHDGDYRIPIVAESPDKVEQRSATLSFVRETRRAGEVDESAQPRELPPLRKDTP
jgi:hypothetical protein